MLNLLGYHHRFEREDGLHEDDAFEQPFEQADGEIEEIDEQLLPGKNETYTGQSGAGQQEDTRRSGSIKCLTDRYVMSEQGCKVATAQETEVFCSGAKRQRKKRV